MWSYYGSKSKIAKLYPKPKYPLIIEPFAGAAWYSVLHRDKNVLLNEKNQVISDIWEWLIYEATAPLLLAYSNFYVGQDIRDLALQKQHRDLIGFCINRGSSSPRNIVQKWSCQVKARPDWASTVHYRLNHIASLLPEIKHWHVSSGDYEELPNIEATWFIDPPYQFGGEHYIVNDIDYNQLSDWCRTRKGQVIVCENSRANWLPFRQINQFYGQKKRTVEVVWTNNV